MPGPTSKNTYIGRSLGASLGAMHQRRAETIVQDHPACDVCGRPMVCGQGRSNSGAHFSCRPSPAAFGRLGTAGKESCADCWADLMLSGDPSLLDHERHAVTL